MLSQWLLEFKILGTEWFLVVTVSKKLPERRLERREKCWKRYLHGYRCHPGLISRSGARETSMPSSNVFSGQGVIGRQITPIRSDSDGVSLKKCRF